MTIGHETETGERTLWQAMKAAASSVSDDFGRFVVANAVWLAVAAGAVQAGNFVFAAYAALLLLVPASYGVCRMAANAARGRPARLAQLRAGSMSCGWAGFGLGCAQLIVIGLAATNVTIAAQAPTLLLVLSAIISGYAGLFVMATVFVLWPLLLDPAGTRAVGPTLRLGLTVIATRPARILALVLVEAGLIAAGLQAVPAALILPAFGLVLASWVVLPLADQIRAGASRSIESVADDIAGSAA